MLLCAACAAAVRFSAQHREAEQALYDEAVARRSAARAAGLAVANAA